MKRGKGGVYVHIIYRVKWSFHRQEGTY